MTWRDHIGQAMSLLDELESALAAGNTYEARLFRRQIAAALGDACRVRGLELIDEMRKGAAPHA